MIPKSDAVEIMSTVDDDEAVTNGTSTSTRILQQRLIQELMLNG